MTRFLTRTGLTALMTSLSLVLFAGIAAADASPTAEERFAAGIDRERAAAGLPSLVVEQSLVSVAREWSEEMAAADSLSHRPDLGAAIPGDWTSVGENVGFTISPGASTEQLVDRLHDAFMASPGHRDNVLGAWNTVGVGATVTPTGKMWVTVNFAQMPITAPAPAPAPPPVEAPAPAPAPVAPAPLAPAAPALTAGQLQEAVRVSQQVFADDAADFVVLARAEVFADALGGTGLAGRSAPVLFTPGPGADPDPELHPVTRAEVDRVLAPGATVYVLGGTSAIAPDTEAELRDAGYEVVRLAGVDRVETSVRVADEVLRLHGPSGEVLLARPDEWADAISGGAYAARTGTPVVLTPGDRLAPSVEALLARSGAPRIYALGGTAALSDAVVDAAGAERVAGADRTATAVAVAQRLWGRTEAALGDGYVTAPGFSGDGWAYALANVPLSAAHGAPQLLVGEQVSPAVTGYLDGLGYSGEVAGEVWAASTVSGSVLEHLQSLVR